MSPRTLTGDHAPSLEALEHACELVKREADRLLARAREPVGALQDAAAELEDGWAPGAVLCHNRAAWDLRVIARMFSRAQLELVHQVDERAKAKPHVRGFLDEAERTDAPWRDAA